MACFLVPAAEAVITTIAAKAIESKEAAKASENGMQAVPEVKIPFSRKLKWLNSLLWGGAALLAFEHVWHGEVTPFYPFLTAASDPASTSEMLHEMATAGVAMAVLVTLVWCGMLIVSSVFEKKALKAQTETE